MSPGGPAWEPVNQATVTISSNDPSTLYVWQGSPNPTPPYLTWETAATNIQDAVDAAWPGETLLVTNGVYAAGARTGNRVAVDKAVAVQSVNGPLATVIDGGDLLRCVYLANGASLFGFTVTNGAADNGGGILGQSPNAVVSNCVISGNLASLQGGGGVRGRAA